EERHSDLDALEAGDLLIEVEQPPPRQQRAEAFDEQRNGREAQRHVRERDLRRLDREQPQHRRERLRLLRRQAALRLRCERRRPKAEETVARLSQPLCQPGRRLFHPPVLGEPARELLGRLLRAELGELRLLVREERARLQLEQRGDKHEELAARLEIELLALGETLDKRDDDPATSTS